MYYKERKKENHVTTQLPNNYRTIYTIDLEKDRKKAFYIDIIAVITMIVMGVMMHLFLPITTLFSMEKGFGIYSLRFAVMFIGMLGYISIHEFTRGIVMKRYGAKKVDFGYEGLYAYAGSEATFFEQWAFTRITLAPLIIWGVILLGLNMLVGKEWIWVVYMVQLINISGATGDVYVVWKIRKLSGKVWVKDNGGRIQVYGA